jgi:hypothetical protein
MTRSDRIHRNARMILEAARIRRPVGYGGSVEWDFGGGSHVKGSAHFGIRSEDRKLRWSLYGGGKQIVNRDVIRTIFRGILAPRLLDEIRARVASYHDGNCKAVNGEWVRDGVLAIIDEVTKGSE